MWLRSKTWAENGMFFSWQASKAVKGSPSWESLRWSMEWGGLVMEYASRGCLDHTGRQASVSGCGVCSEENNEDIWKKSVAFKKRGWGPQGSWHLISMMERKFSVASREGWTSPAPLSEFLPVHTTHPVPKLEACPGSSPLPRGLPPPCMAVTSLNLSEASHAWNQSSYTRHYLLLVLCIVCFPELPPTSKNARGATRFCGDRNSFDVRVFL